MNEYRQTPWILWPFSTLWRLLSWILTLTGRFVIILLGIIFMIVGVIVTLTIIGAIIGVPLFLFGILLVFRGLF
jgi:hypothetical protein